MSFLGEIKRRKVFQVAAVYLVVAWLIVQVVDVIGEPFLLPDWFSRVVIVLLAIGFPLALIFSWAFDLTPDGVTRDPGTVQSGGRQIEYVLIGLMAVSIGWLLYRDIAPSPENSAESSVITLEEAEAVPQPTVLENSVAVLPFENMSANPDDAYFAAGIHDEILNQLAQIRSLNVIARTSVMQYAGVARPITEIADELNVGTVMEGSVSYAGGRVAIRAQLIDANDGTHLWSQTYNRELVDIFAIQADIATNIANALEAEFSSDEQRELAERSTDSPEAYALYLRAIDSFSVASPETSSLLGRAIELDPDFAEAYAFRAHVDATRGQAVNPDDVYTALELDSSLAIAHAVLAILHENDGRMADAEQSYEEAIRLNPGAENVLANYARFLRNRGEYEKAIGMLERTVALSPLDFQSYHQLAISYRYNREYDAAAIAAENAIGIIPANPTPHTGLAYIEVSRGNHDRAYSQLQLSEQLGAGGILWRLPQMAYAYSQIGQPEEAVRLFDLFDERAGAESAGDGAWAMAYLATGDYDRSVASLEAALQEQGLNRIPLAEIKANAYQDPVLETPQFQALRERIGSL